MSPGFRGLFYRPGVWLRRFDGCFRTWRELQTLLEANPNRRDARVRAECIERDRADAGRRLGRRAGLKFDAHAAERLSALLEGQTAREDLDRVSDRVIECATGKELLSRASALRAPAGAGPGGNLASRI